jgi:hypothetical protein
MRNMPSLLIDHLRAPDRGDLASLLAPAVRFHSPVADYEGRDRVAHLFGLIARVLTDLEPRRELTEGTATATFFTAAIGGQPLDGVLDEHLGPDGRVVEATLMLRPYTALRSAIAAMAEALETDPLP